MTEVIAETKGLTKHFLSSKKGLLDSLLRAKVPMVKAVDGVDIVVRQGEILALVGESGSGKTTLGRLLTSLEAPTKGEIYFLGQKVKGRKSVKTLRKSVQMVFQNPLDSLDPRMPIKGIVTEPLSTLKMNKAEKNEAFSKALSHVGLQASTFADRRPRDLSGGQRQRVAVARAIISNPKFIVLDEPTSALDASVQSQVLNLLAQLHDELGFTYLLITHNINIARYISDTIAVMYAGKVVETGPTEQVLRSPKHPYTQALFSAVPSLRSKEIVPPVGEVPSLVNLPPGCRFNPRCPYVMGKCLTTEPSLLETEGAEVACWLYEKK